MNQGPTRRVPYPDKKVIDWLTRIAEDEGHRSSDHYRHFIASGLWATVYAFDGVIPVGVKKPGDLYTSGVGDRFAQHMKLLEEIGGEERRNIEIYISFLSFKLLEESDTPIWIQPSSDLISMLAVTDLKGVKSSDLKVPFPAFVLGLPKGLITWKADMGTSIMDMDLRAIVVSTTKSDVFLRPGPVSTQDLQEAMRKGGSVDSRSQQDDPSTLELDTLKCAGFSFPSNGRGTLEERMPLLVHPFALIVDPSHDVSPRDAILPMIWNREIFTPVAIKKHGGKEEMRYLEETMVSLLANVLLYITSRDDLKERIKHSGPPVIRKKGKREAARVWGSYWDEWVVGSKVRLAREDRDDMHAAISSRSLTFAHLRRGHWRNQAYGPVWSLRKMKWIEPCVVRRDLGKVFGHEYV